MTRLDTHREALAACRRCGLLPGIAPIVSLAVSPKVMLVGQAPGKVESAGGRPFSGRAGAQLFRWFAAAGIDEPSARRRIYIAAVTRCFPGAHPSGRGDRLPSRAEQESCASWLEAELAIIRPRIIIPVGRLAIGRFLPEQPLDRLVGRVHRIERGGREITVIPLPHPSGASSWIHQAEHKTLVKNAIDDLRAHVAPLVTRGHTK